MAGNAPEVARATVTIIPSMEGAQKTISDELGAAADSAGGSAGKRAGSSFSSALKGGLATAGVAVAAVGTAAVAGGKALVSAAGDVASYGDEIDKMSQKLGISAEAYQEWDFIAQHSGTSMASLKTSFKTLANAAQDGKSEFEALGISLEDAASMSTEDLFAATIAGLQNMEEGTERTALASTLLGKGATELGALLNTSAADTEAMRQQVHDLGGVMSDEAVKSSAAFQDSLQNMTTSLSGLKNNMMSDFLPSLTTVMDGMTALFTGDTEGGLAMISGSIDTLVAQLTEKLPELLQVGLGIVEALASAILANLPALADAALQLLGSLTNFVLENLPMLIEIGLNILMTIADGIISNLPTLIPAVVSVILEIVDKLTQPDMIAQLIDAALQLIIALAEGLIKALPQLIAKAPVIIGNLVVGLYNAFNQINQAAVDLIGTLISGIASCFGDLIAKGSEIIQQVKDGIHQKIEDAKNWGKDLIANFIGGIKEKWENLKKTISDIAGTIKDFLGFSEPSKGPLSNFHTYAPDMMELFAKGIRDNEGVITSQLESSLDIGGAFMMEAPAAGGDMISALKLALEGLAGDMVIPIYIGQEKIDEQVVRATQRANYRSGGR